MRTIAYGVLIPAGVIEAYNRADGVLLIESAADYDRAPADVRAIVAVTLAASQQAAQDAVLSLQFTAERQAKEAAEFAAFKARAGQPSYKAAVVKIAAEKLGLLDAIDAAIIAEVEKAADKALLVWWRETDAISRGDAQWQQIEAAVQWGKGASAAQLFDLAAQI